MIAKRWTRFSNGLGHNRAKVPVIWFKFVSFMAVDRESMYIGSAGPGGRVEGRTDGWRGRRVEGMDGCKGRF